jgi:uncharacterized oxidoreductase
MDIAGKRALVTGGSSGIGFALAGELLQRGAAVVVTGRRTEIVQQAVESLSSDGNVAGVAADVTTGPGREQTLSGALDILGGLDILVNNAGGVRAGRLESVSEDEILQTIAVNLAGPVLLTRSALPALKASGEGLIVNISSGIALVGFPFYSPYAAVKAGIAHFGEALRRELAGEGVGVLTVYPTATETPMMATSRMSPDGRESATDVAREIAEAIVEGRRDVIRGGEERVRMIALNRTDPIKVDAALEPMKDGMEAATRDHKAL